ncbi:MAG: hypothetical protein U5O39_04780 [Gammaproteobacteria bacterium]|nr:hypothetical protein [Gammaproteobacteria bacterium]
MRLFFGLALLAFASGAFAWSADGHKLICQLAYDKLSDEARTFVIRTLALGEELDGNGSDDFAEACLWPDSARYEGDLSGPTSNISSTCRARPMPLIWHGIAPRSIALPSACSAASPTWTGVPRAAVSKAGKRLPCVSRPLYGRSLYQPLHAGHGEDWGRQQDRCVLVRRRHEPASGLGQRHHDQRPTSPGPTASRCWPPSQTDDPPEQILSALKSSFRLARSHAYPNVSGGPIRSGDSLGDGYFERAKPIVIEQDHDERGASRQRHRRPG